MSLRHHLANTAARELERQFNMAPWLKHYHLGEWITREFYVSLMIQLIHRTRSNNKADALALHLCGNDLFLAKQFSAYLSSEIYHEDYAIKDLTQLQVSPETIFSAGMLLENRQLISYLYYEAATHQDVFANVVWNWLQQWYSDTYDQKISGAARRIIDPDCTEGFDEHFFRHQAEIKSQVSGQIMYEDIVFAQVEHCAQSQDAVDRAELYTKELISMYIDLLKAIKMTVNSGPAMRSNV